MKILENLRALQGVERDITTIRRIRDIKQRTVLLTATAMGDDEIVQLNAQKNPTNVGSAGHIGARAHGHLGITKVKNRNVVIVHVIESHTDHLPNSRVKTISNNDIIIQKGAEDLLLVARMNRSEGEGWRRGSHINAKEVLPMTLPIP
jgi:hypothetical protein